MKITRKDVKNLPNVEVKRRGSYTADIDPADVYHGAKVFALIELVILIIIGIVLGLVKLDLSDNEGHNIKAAEFNSYSQHERELIVKYATNLSVDDDSFMTPGDEQIHSSIIHHGINIAIGIVICLIFALPGLVFKGYWKEKSSDYHLADLPLTRPYGWVLLFSMIGLPWLILIVARIDMHRQIKKFGQDIEKAAQRSARAAKQKPIDVEELYQVFRQNARAFEDKYRPDFIRLASSRYTKAHEAKVKQAQNEVNKAEGTLTDLGDKLKTAQRNLNDAKAQLRKAQLNAQAIAETQNTAATATAEWQAIQEMRGVIKMSVPHNQCHSKKQLPFLVILVRVYVPYNHRVYDFGDYEIKLYPDCSFTCFQTRSGLIANFKTMNYPDYNQEEGGFCFGRRYNSIEEHLKRGQIVEAVTIIIDSLHSVNNDEHAERIPQTFKEVINVTEVTNSLPSVEKKKSRKRR